MCGKDLNDSLVQRGKGEPCADRQSGELPDQLGQPLPVGQVPFLGGVPFLPYGRIS
ncbi:hypothetical protein D3C81_2204730 [compost metagenome]